MSPHARHLLQSFLMFSTFQIVIAAKPCPINTFDKPSLEKSCSRGNQFGSICTITCQPGYHVVELVKRPRTKKYTSTCEVRGEGVDWSRPAPTCKAKKCLRLRSDSRLCTTQAIGKLKLILFHVRE